MLCFEWHTNCCLCVSSFGKRVLIHTPHKPNVYKPDKRLLTAKSYGIDFTIALPSTGKEQTQKNVDDFQNIDL